jgi:hypothetical protein
MSQRIPGLFIGHGNPMNTLLNNSYTQQWAALGTCVPSREVSVVNKRRTKPRIAQHRFCVLRRNIFQQYTPHVSTCVVGQIPTTV